MKKILNLHKYLFNFFGFRHVINIPTIKSSNKNVYNSKCSGFTLVELLVALIIFIIITSMVEYGPAPPRDLTPQKTNLKIIKVSIDQYYADRGRYPKYLIDLTHNKHPYLKEIPIDPLTGMADWEVAELSGPQKTWYRTSEENYPNAPVKWNPSPESSIFDIRPKQQKYQLVEE